MPGPFGPTAAEKAAAIRAEIKRQAASGALAVPAGVKFSVQTERASLMTAINVTVKGAPAAWAAAQVPCQVPADCRALATALMEIIGRHFRADGRMSFAEVRIDGGRTIAFAG